MREHLEDWAWAQTIVRFTDRRPPDQVVQSVRAIALVDDGVVFTEVNVRFGGGCAAAFWGTTHLVEQYLTLLTTGERRLPARLHGTRTFGTTTLVRVPGYVTLQAGPETGESAAPEEP
jgi:hypothetical protein